MNTTKISPDDPRLTAFALGELEGAEREAVAAAVAASPELQAEVEAIRSLSGELSGALAAEPSPAEPVRPIFTAGHVHMYDPEEDEIPTGRRHWLWLSGLLATGVAASLTILVVVNVTQKQDFPWKSAGVPLPVDARGSHAAPAHEGRAAEVPSIVLTVSEPATAAAPAVPELNALVGTGVANAQESKGEGNIGEFVKEVPGVSVNYADDQAQTIMVRGFDGGFTPVKVEGNRMVQVGSNSIAPGSGPALDQYTYDKSGVAAATCPPAQPADFNTEGYEGVKDNPFLAVRDNPLSTFSIDVDTACYANVRRFLTGGSLPPAAAVRIEELVNYFRYSYRQPVDETPFAADLEAASAPWSPTHRLVRIGIQGREVAAAVRAPANLVFLVDVSGSMQPENKLPLVRNGLKMLVERLRKDDRVAIAVYAGASGLALPSTPVSESQKILAAIDALRPGGSTNGAMGIQLAYDIAKANFIKDGLNRVILCTDGDFNVGVTSRADLLTLIQDKAQSGVFLTVLGFGMGNYKDDMCEMLADRGNGAYGYIDTEKEARRVFIERVEGTLMTIAKDVKIQVEFNPARVQAYRLIGYENRMLAAEDFNNDRVDAGEIGAGHSVTALYEVIPAGVEWKPESSVDPLKYQTPASRDSAETAFASGSAEMLTVKVRYKEPAGDVSRKLEFPLVDAGRSFEEASPDFRFASAVAGFGMLLRHSPHAGSASYAAVLDWASAAQGGPDAEARAGFLELVRCAEKLTPM